MAEAKKGKKFINSPQDCVHDSLYGFMRVNPQLKLLEGYNTVIRADVDHLIQTRKVCLVTGGGSGHEPSSIGYIGKGMLTASVCGNVFASPSATAIFTAIRECASPAGVLLIVTNYTGDRLNFGKAAELAKNYGIKVEMVIVGEDCAITCKDKNAGRRGLCGTMFIHKIAGAMAENGSSLEEIKTFAESVVKDMGTISISLSPCSIPGQAATFQIADDEAEFGLGIHGEPGVKKIKMASAKDFVKEMIDHIEKSSYVAELNGRQLAVFVNNLGGTSQLELSLMTGEVFKSVESRNGNIVRCYAGHLMTSLEMAGISITILVVNDEIVHLLDQETSVPSWPKQGKAVENDNIKRKLISVLSDSTETTTVVGEEVTKQGILLWKCANVVCDMFISKEETLNGYDRNAGDGDCGTTFARGAYAIKESLGSVQQPNLPVNHPDRFFLAVGSIAESSMGGSSGALVALFFTAASSALKDGLTAKSLVKALKQGTEAISRYGGADEGERTMLDALFPLLRSLEGELDAVNVSPEKLVAIGQRAALEGARKTVGMKARAGRASYVSSAHFTDPDAGATAVAFIMEALSDYLKCGI